MFLPYDLFIMLQIKILDWYIDQKLISIRLNQWMVKNGRKNVILKPRNTRVDRFDRIRPQWNCRNFMSKNDAHLPINGIQNNSWNDIRCLLQAMYKGKNKELQYAINYKNNFTKYFNQDM